MNIYHLPGNGIFGGIKVGYQFAGILDELGVPILVATPDGQSPQWFSTNVATISHKRALELIVPGTNVIFSYPPDYPELLSTKSNLINHCQGTDDRMNVILSNHEVKILTCWRYAYNYTKKLTGRNAIEVGIHISDKFFYNGESKIKNQVACMPRKGSRLIDVCEKDNPQLHFVRIDNYSETKTAQILKKSDIFLATSVDEMFGLPALEAMAAGAVVVTVPVVGGMDYLRQDKNCILSSPENLAKSLNYITDPRQHSFKEEIRLYGRLTANNYMYSSQKRFIKTILDNEISFFKDT